MADDAIHVRAREPIDTIRPTVHGHFAEHLGKGVYPGIWVGEDADVEHEGGIRCDTVELLRELGTTVVRWPGGCFADDYHWQDGIGPREERPQRRNLWWVQGPEYDLDETKVGVEESNQFGTDEFCSFCERVGAEPYLAVNVGSGTVEEAMAWMEYVNWDGRTEWADRRRANGHEEPHEVKYWGIGNESWSCGGQYDPDEYAEEYTRFASFLSTFEAGMLGEDLDLEFVAVGNSDREWNRTVLDNVNRYLPDHIGLHSYVGKSGCGDGAEFDDEEFYRLIAQAYEIDEFVQRARDTTNSMFPAVTIAVDEWGVWHPQATHANGLAQDATVRDALAAAVYLDTFHAHADVVQMANLAQTVNVLHCVVKTEYRGDGSRDDGGEDGVGEDDVENTAAYPTPTYRVFELYRPHQGNTALPVHVETDVREVAEEDDDVPMIGASASRARDTDGESDGDGDLYVTASNRDLERTRTVEVDVETVDPADATARVAFDGVEPDVAVTPENAGQFAPTAHAAALVDGTVTVDVPPAAVVGVDISV